MRVQPQVNQNASMAWNPLGVQNDSVAGPDLRQYTIAKFKYLGGTVAVRRGFQQIIKINGLVKSGTLELPTGSLCFSGLLSHLFLPHHS
jgi:hypothetical protein